MSILGPDPAEMIKQNLNKFFTDPTNLNNPKKHILVPIYYIFYEIKFCFYFILFKCDNCAIL